MRPGANGDVDIILALQFSFTDKKREFVGLHSILKPGIIVVASTQDAPINGEYLRTTRVTPVSLGKLEYDWLGLSIKGDSRRFFVPPTMLFHLEGEILRQKIERIIEELYPVEKSRF